MSSCVCDVLPQLETSARVSFVFHTNELRRSTNTGFLAALALGAERRVHRGPLHGLSGLLLVPGAARVLQPKDRGTPLTFLDGSWRQVSRMVRKRSELQELTPVSLPVEEASVYPLREGGRFDELSTLEAAAIAMGIVESADHERALRRLLNVFVERALSLRGLRQAGVGHEGGSDGSEKIHSCSGPSSGGGEGADGPT